MRKLGKRRVEYWPGRLVVERLAQRDTRNKVRHKNLAMRQFFSASCADFSAISQCGDKTKIIKKVVPAAGVEPATFRSGGERSNPLSYAGLNRIAGFKEVHQNVLLFTPFCTPRQSGGSC